MKVCASYNEPNLMKVTVRFFASYRERIGKRSMDVTLERNATVGDLVTYINEKFPGFAPHPDRIVVAVNEEYVSHDQRLKDGDEAAFIPPVSGGAINDSTLFPMSFPTPLTERGSRGEVASNKSEGAIDISTSSLSFDFPLSVATERGLRGEV